MCAEEISVWSIRYEGTLAVIGDALQGLAPGDERRRRLQEIGAWVEKTPVGVKPAIRAAIEEAIQRDLLTEEEAIPFLPAC